MGSGGRASDSVARRRRQIHCAGWFVFGRSVRRLMKTSHYLLVSNLAATGCVGRRVEFRLTAVQDPWSCSMKAVIWIIVAAVCACLAIGKFWKGNVATLALIIIWTTIVFIVDPTPGVSWPSAVIGAAILVVIQFALVLLTKRFIEPGIERWGARSLWRRMNPDESFDRHRYNLQMAMLEDNVATDSVWRRAQDYFMDRHRSATGCPGQTCSQRRKWVKLLPQRGMVTRTVRHAYGGRYFCDTCDARVSGRDILGGDDET
jgi:hypothetical protein